MDPKNTGKTAPALQSPLTYPPAETDLFSRALQKARSGQALTRQEMSALKREQADREETLRWKFYRAIPQKHWAKMSGRQCKVLNEQAKRYGIPFGGPVINLEEVVRSLHDFLADKAQLLARGADEMLLGSGSPALEQYRAERAKIARIDRLERERRVLPVNEIRQSLSQVAAILRTAGETLGREHGPAAAEILHEALEDSDREVDRMFSQPETGADVSDADGT